MKNKIAKLFSQLLYEELGEVLFDIALRAKNNIDTGYCETQDECDANMVMYHAVSLATVGTEYVDLENEEANELMSEAWEVAKENEFFVHELYPNSLNKWL